MFTELDKITLGNKELFLKVLAAHHRTLVQFQEALEDIEATGQVHIEEFAKIAHKAKSTLLTLQQQKLVFKLYEWIEKAKSGHCPAPDFIAECRSITSAVAQKLGE